MAKPYDVAAYIVSKCDLMTTMKLQKLVYYSYAIYAGIYGTPLFDEEFEAWRNGPVVRSLYAIHRRFILAEESLFSEKPCLKAEEINSIDMALDIYGDYTARELSAKTHSERPWKETRGDLDEFASSTSKIPFELVKSWANREYASIW